MKTKIGILVLALSTSFFSLQAQRTVTTARATSYDISDNLDLDAVASIFGDSENLEDFERRLNDPDNRISNLDLNEDGYIDYLRVVENSSDRNSLVVVQAVLDKDVFQDVATIEVERVSNGNPRVQIVGDAYIYGSDYIIEPVYVHTPLIFSFFWSPRYTVWHSPYYWNYYPRWYRSYRPYSPFRYQRNVYVHINRYNTYHRANTRNIHYSGDNYNHIRRNDYASRYPNRAFESRNHGVKNRNELNERRPSSSANHARENSRVRSNSNSGRVQQNSQSGQRTNSRPSVSRNQSTTKSAPVRTQNRVQSNKKSSYSNGNSNAGSSRNRSNTNVKSNSNNSRVQQNSQSGQRTNSRPSVSRSQSTTKSAPVRTQNRVQSNRKSSVSSGNSNAGSNRSRSNNTVKSTQKSEKRSGSTKKESSEKRRTR